MARFLVWSDLHDEFWNGFDLPDLSRPVDGVLIGGDTHTRGRHLDIPAAAARKYGCPVVVIWGNHEAYGSIWSELLAEEAKQLATLHAEGLDIRVLHGASTEIAGVRIIGATLWTDFKLYPGLEALARIVVPRLLNDYHDIRPVPGRLFTKDDMLALHAEQKAAVFDALAQPYPGPTVVMTHHLPVRQLIHPAREIGRDQDRVLSAGFASDLWDEIKAHDVHSWIWGHSHEGDAWTGRAITGRSASSPTSAATRAKRWGSIRRLCWRCSGWQGWCEMVVVAQDNPDLVASGVSQGRSRHDQPSGPSGA